MEKTTTELYLTKDSNGLIPRKVLVARNIIFGKQSTFLALEYEEYADLPRD